MIFQFMMVQPGKRRFVFFSDGGATRTRFVYVSDGGHQNDAIRGFRVIKHSIRRGDLDLGVFGPGRSGSSRSLFSYRFRLLIT